jgi:hypothetical protein
MSRSTLGKSHKARRLVRAAAWLAAAWSASAHAGLEVNPVFPAYGDPIALELNNVGTAPWVPGTRYRREGNSITLEMENAAGGLFGPPGMDMQDMPVAIGELAPGRYALQARLYDLADPTAVPRIFSHSLEVAAPDAQGVYSVPRSPGALQEFELVVRADAPIDAKSLRATVNGASVRIDFSYTLEASATGYAAVKVPGLAPGTYRAEAFGTNGTIVGAVKRFAGDFNVANTSAVVEYYAPTLDHYVITAWPDEIAALDAGTGFKRTGQQFKAWLRASDAPGYAVPVCRFYATGPNSHFYTADPGECQMLKSLEQKQKAESLAKGQSFGGWQFEAIAFYALAPQGGACAAGSTPVYRAYNGRGNENDSNHRFTVTAGMRFAMSRGWFDEGVAFCSPA